MNVLVYESLGMILRNIKIEAPISITTNIIINPKNTSYKKQKKPKEGVALS